MEVPEEATKNNPIWVPKRRMAVMAVIIATLGSFGLGMTLVWSAIGIKSLEEAKVFGDLSEGEKSLIGSLIYLGALVSAPLTGLVISAIGRKKTMLIASVPCFIGWLLIAFAQDLWMVYLGRFITGFCGGSFTVSIPAYVSEVTEDRIRGTLGTVMILMLVCGIEFTFVIGAFTNWFWLSIVSATVPVIFFTCMFFMPESPRYLIMKRKPTAARKALQWLRRASRKIHIEPEINQIEQSVTAYTSPVKSCSLTDIMTFPVLKPVALSITLMGFSQFSGMNGIALYTSDVFEKAGTNMDPRYALMIIWGAQALSVLIVTFFLVENFRRKTLLTVSQIGMMVGLVAFGVSFHVQVDNKMPENLEWLPLGALVTFIVGYNVGMGPLPWLVTSEILPPNVRELASSIVTFFYWGLSFLAGITFIPLEQFLGSSILYWLCAGVTLVSTLFVIFLIPETKGKSAEEIQKYFSGSSNNKKCNNEEVHQHQSCKSKKDLESGETETEFTTSVSREREGISNPGFEEVDMR